MKITISFPVNGISLNGDEYALVEEGGEALVFDTVKEAVNYLADCNWTITDLRILDWHIEEETE